MNARYLLGLIALLLSLNACGVQFVTMKIYVHEENGKPIEGAMVKGIFFQDQVVNKKSLDSHKGITNRDGFIELSGYEEIYVDLIVEKHGYYVSQRRTNVRGSRGREVPIMLRKKRNPISMRAKKIMLTIPERGREFEFDFFKGDLVKPGHDGNQSDIKIRFDRNIIDNNNYTQSVSMSFVNPLDGIVEMKTNKDWEVSNFKTPYYAPPEGYMPNIKLIYARGLSGVTKTNVNTPFFIRIRTSADKNGNITEAFYCKIWPGMMLYGVLAEKPSLEMTYYCNSSVNDKNVEFDPKNNLFNNLKHSERVVLP